MKGGAVAEARCLAAYVAARAGGISRRRMARRFHLDDSSLARPVARLESRLERDSPLRQTVEHLIQDLRVAGFMDLAIRAMEPSKHP